MKFPYLMAAGLLLSALVACKKDTPELQGNASTSAFTFEIRKMPGGDTLPFSNTVTFNNTSTDGFSYLWDFGDANTSVLKNPVHSYESGTSFLVKLTSVGKNGNSTSSHVLEMESPCDNAAFNFLTGCGNRKWSMSPLGDAIRVLDTDGSTVLYTGAGAGCQTDDEYTFSVTGALNYDAQGQTFTTSCQTSRPNAKKFWLIKSGTGNGRIVLDTTAGGARSFLGTYDAVQDNSYEIRSIEERAMTLAGKLADGKTVEVKMVNGDLDAATIKQILTGGSRKTWRLDSTAGANTIVVGTEANPTTYYSGGPLAPCQKDDWYTFTTSDSIIVNCNGSTLQPSQGFTCGADESFSAKFTMGNVTGGFAGLAALNLQANNPDQWIGVFDRGPENVYRILEISSTRLLLRSGNGSGVVHTMKFVAK